MNTPNSRKNSRKNSRRNNRKNNRSASRKQRGGSFVNNHVGRPVSHLLETVRQFVRDEVAAVNGAFRGVTKAVNGVIGSARKVVSRKNRRNN